MGKGIKNIAKKAIKTLTAVLSAAAVAAIMLPLLATLLINIPAVQNALARKAMRVLSERLGTTVSVGRVHVKFINRVVAEDFYVEDFEGDTLLFVPRVTVPVIEPGLFGKSPVMGRVELEEAQMWLRWDSLGDVNIKKVVDAIRGDREKDSGRAFRLDILGVEARDLTFGMLRGDRPLREGVDFSRFVIRNTQIDIDRLVVAGDSLRIGIRSLSFDERSGFRMDNLSAHDLVVVGGTVLLDNVSISTPGARLDAPYIHLRGEGWESYRNFIDSVPLDISLRRSSVTSDMVGWFLPAAKGRGIDFERVTATTKGPVGSMEGRLTDAHTPGGTSLEMSFRSRGLPDFENLWLDLELRQLTTRAAEIDSLLRTAAGWSLPEDVSAALDRMGTITVEGHFNGDREAFGAVGKAVTDAGEMNASLALSPAAGGGSAFRGEVSVPRFDLGRTLAYANAGAVSGSAAMRGVRERGGAINGNVEGRIDAAGFKGYVYNDISFSGMLDNRRFDGSVAARDGALDFDFRGMLDFNADVPRYDFGLDLRRADLAAANLVTADSVALLSGRLTASGSGDDLDNLNGRIEIRDPAYISSADTLRSQLIAITGNNSADSKQITLRSDFVDGEFRSRISYRDVFAYLGDFLRDYTPLLYDDRPPGAPSRPEVEGASDPSNYSALNVRTKNTDRLLGVLMPGTQIAEGTEISFLFNPFARNFSLAASSDFIEYRNSLATRIELSSDNKSDSLTLHLTSEDFYSGTLFMPNLALHAGAKGRRMKVSTRLSEPREELTALLSLDIDSQDDGKVRIRFSPSYIALADRTWYLTARSILWEKGRTTVDRFRIYTEGSREAELAIDGVVSRGAADTLHIRFNEFNLAPLNRLTEGRGYRAAGTATGYVDFISVLRQTRMISGIDFRGLSLNGAEAAPLRFTSFWDREAERVRFQMLNQRSSVNVLKGSFAPAGGAIDAVATLDSIDVKLLDPLLPGILANTSGKAGFRITFGGTLRALRMNGRIDIPWFRTTIDFTQAEYTLTDGVMDVVDSRLKLRRTTVSDRFGNTADLDLGVDLSNMRNVGFDLRAAARNLLAFDTGPEDNEAFYGRVFATGALAMRGDRLGTKMELSATTGRNSDFHLPLNAKSNISWADFVVFSHPSDRPSEENVLSRKKEIYERQLRRQSAVRPGKPFDVDLTIDLTPEARFSMVIDPSLGNGISAHGHGLINLRINPAANLFSMVGDCTITEGRFDFSMMNLFSKEFTITPGSTLTWTGEPEDVLLNVEATYRVRTPLTPLVGGNSNVATRSVPIDCVLRLAGRLSQPEITFDVRLPSIDADSQMLVDNAMNTQELKSMQFLSLLMFGTFVSDNSLAGQASNVGAAASGSVGFEFLSSQLSNLLSNEDYNIYFRYRPQDGFMSNQLDVGFSKGFIDNRLILEIEGNYVEDRAANSVGVNNVSNLSGDFYLTWVIDRSGNLRLKVFSQTIDRWNENQGLQESGIGIYYKKDFDSIRDIWRKNTKFGSKPSRRAEEEDGAEVAEIDGTEESGVDGNDGAEVAENSGAAEEGGAAETIKNSGQNRTE